ncbi:MAG: hypothetical protein KGI60_01730 [Patescibacteria group bacterium]|nr:hypothetical protein [Patescibacteria group bacterium]
MKKIIGFLSAHRFAVAAAVVAVCIIGVIGIRQVITVRRAHATFENYYAFRGCVQLLERGDDYGMCRTDSGQVIRIVRFRNRWYLDGDLPQCDFGICF